MRFLWTNKYINTHICLRLNRSSLHLWRNSFSAYEDTKFHTCFSLPKTLGNEQCLKLLLGVCNTKKEGRTLFISVEDTVWSRILIKEFKYFHPKKTKKWFLSSKKYDPGCSSRIPDPDADFLPSRIQGSKRHPIPDPRSGSATLWDTGVSCLREDDGEHGGAQLAVDLRHPHLHLLNSHSNSFLSQLEKNCTV